MTGDKCNNRTSRDQPIHMPIFFSQQINYEVVDKGILPVESVVGCSRKPTMHT
jgi:hypothetical protein